MALVLRTSPVYSPPRSGGISGVAKDTASWLKDYLTAVKHGRWHPFTLLERKTREATRNEPWGPTGTLLNELADASFSHADCRIIFAVLFFRLGYPAAKWRNVYKGLTVLDFLLKRGSDEAVAIAREELVYRLEDLTRFQYVTPEGRDQGINVRHRAQAILALLRDPERLERERRDFAARRPALSGFSRDAAPVGLGLSSAATFVSQVAREHRANGVAGGGSGGPDEGRAASPDLRGKEAGEMKGVTLEENRKHLAALRELLRRPENSQCADCISGGRPAWASINCGVFICLSCAGLHRGLGVHVSQVRSCSLDTWLPGQVAFMTATGNAVANAYWAGRRAAAARLPSGSPDLANHLARKYRDHAFAASDGVWPPVEALQAVAEANGVRQEPKHTVVEEPEPEPAPQPPPQPLQRKPAAVTSPLRPPPRPSLMDEELDVEAGFRAAGAVPSEQQAEDDQDLAGWQQMDETTTASAGNSVRHGQPPSQEPPPQHRGTGGFANGIGLHHQQRVAAAEAPAAMHGDAPAEPAQQQHAAGALSRLPQPPGRAPHAVQQQQQPVHTPTTAHSPQPVQAPRPPQRAAFDASLLDGTPRAFEAGLQAAYGFQPAGQQRPGRPQLAGLEELVPEPEEDLVGAQAQDVFGDLSRGPAASAARGLADQPNGTAAALANGIRHADSSSPAQPRAGSSHAVTNGHHPAAQWQGHQVSGPSAAAQRHVDTSWRDAPQGLLRVDQDSTAGYLRGQRAQENAYQAAQRRAKQEAGLSQQQRRLQQWANATAGAGMQLPLLRGPVVAPTAAEPPAQPAPSAEQIARARASAFSGEDDNSSPAWQSRIGSPPSMAATAAQAALHRLAEARDAANPRPPVLTEPRPRPEETAQTATFLQPASPPLRPRPRPYRPPGTRQEGDSDVPAASGLRQGAGGSPPNALDGIGSSGVGFRMPLAPSLTPLQAMRQQLDSRSLAGLGVSDAYEAATANERQQATAAGAKVAPQPPVAPRRVSLSELLAAGVVKTKADNRPAMVHIVSDSSSRQF